MSECDNGEGCMSIELDIEPDMSYGDVCVECMKFHCSRCDKSIDVDEEICVAYDVFVCPDCLTDEDIPRDMNGDPLEIVVVPKVLPEHGDSDSAKEKASAGDKDYDACYNCDTHYGITMFTQDGVCYWCRYGDMWCDTDAKYTIEIAVTEEGYTDKEFQYVLGNLNIALGENLISWKEDRVHLPKLNL